MIDPDAQVSDNIPLDAITVDSLKEQAAIGTTSFIVFSKKAFKKFKEFVSGITKSIQENRRLAEQKRKLAEEETQIALEKARLERENLGTRVPLKQITSLDSPQGILDKQFHENINSTLGSIDESTQNQINQNKNPFVLDSTVVIPSNLKHVEPIPAYKETIQQRPVLPVQVTPEPVHYNKTAKFQLGPDQTRPDVQVEKARNEYKNPFIDKAEQHNSQKKPNILLMPFKFVWSLITGIIKGFFRIINLIKNLLFFILFLLLFLMIAIVLIFAYKPVILWNPLKTFLNNEIVPPNSSNTSLDELYNKINLTANNNNVVELTDAEFSKIFVDKLKISEKSFVKFNNNGIDMYLNIDDNTRPLWVIVPTELSSSNKIRIKSIGFGRINTPDFVSNFLNDTTGSIFSFLEKMVTADNYTTAVMGLMNQEKIDKNLTLSKVEVKTGLIYLTYMNSNSTINNY